jgi:SAM-dependent methyltransferase
MKRGKKKREEYWEYPCDLCGLKDAVEVPYARLYTNDQPIHICKKCGFVYVKRRRSAEAIAKAWSEKLYGSKYTARIPAVKARQVYVADFIDVNLGLRDKTVVDIGSGEGQFLEILRDQYGAKVFGIEPSPHNCELIAKMGIGCFGGTIEKYLASGIRARADIVTIVWTLENCFSCRDMLIAARKILKKDGYVAVATGSRILVPFKKPLFSYLGPNPSDTHCFRFSANTLRGILAVNGFEPLQINRYWDTDFLCVIARKDRGKTPVQCKRDHYLDVHHFFERWHQETLFHLKFLPEMLGT